MNLSFYIDRNSPVPLYAQLKDALQQEIQNGNIAYGEKLPSENEFMQALGLSRMTIRTALSQLAEENYVQKVHGVGSFASYDSHVSPMGKIDVLLDVTYTYFASLYIKSISERLTQHKYQFVIHDTQDSQQTICSILDQILKNGSSGVIIQPSHLVEPQLPELNNLILALQQKGIPCVTIDRAIENAPCPSVLFDDYTGGRVAAEHLTSLGHKKCAMVCCSRFSENAPRFEGFNSVLLEKGLPALIPIEKDENLAENLCSLIARESITAIFNYSDKVALKVFHALSMAGLRVPQDISVVGYDDTVFAKTSNPQMTSVIHPKEQLGYTTAEKLISIIEHYPYSVPVKMLSPKLHIRSSCAQLQETK